MNTLKEILFGILGMVLVFSLILSAGYILGLGIKLGMNSWLI